MTRRTKMSVLIAALVLVAVVAAYFASWRGIAVRDDYLLHANAKHLQSTVVTPHLEEPIVAGRNVLWCSTFQLA